MILLIQGILPFFDADSITTPMPPDLTLNVAKYSAILSAVIFNALIIIALVPIALDGMH